MYLFDSLTIDQITAFEKRFWAKVDKKGEDDCWVWKASVEGAKWHKYGKIKLPNSRKTVRAHRAAFFLATDIDPGESLVRHHCDNPLCCNPAHLQIGTHEDNMEDMSLRGRASKPFGSQVGSRNKNCKLTEHQVREIRQKLGSGKKPHEINKDYDVHPDTIRKIGNRKLWSHL